MQTLRGITWDHPRGYACLEAASADYEAKTGVRVSWDKRSLQAFADAPIERLARTYDLIVLDHPHVGKIADTGSLLALEVPEDAEASSLGGSLESYRWKGRLWAYPIDAACHMAVRRSDLGVAGPATWGAILEAAPDDHRMVTALLPVDATCLFMTLVASMGDLRLPVSRTSFVSEATGLRALATLKALYKLGPADALGWNPIMVLEMMASTDEFAYSPALFGYINYARPGFRPRKLEYEALPRDDRRGVSRGILGGAGIGVSSRSASPVTARAFAAWVTSEPVQSGVILENEGQPANLRTWAAIGTDPRFAGFLAGARPAMENAWTRPRDPWFLDFVDDLCNVIPDFFVKNLDEARFLQDLNALYRHHCKEEALQCQSLS